MKKFQIGFIFTLMSLSLIGVGFSSWIVNTGKDMDPASVQTELGEVINLQDYFKITEVNAFDFCSYGPVQEETLTNIPNITINGYMSIDDQIRSTLIKDNSLTISVNITSTGQFNVFDTNYFANRDAINYGFNTTDSVTLNSTVSDAITNSKTISFNLSYSLADFSTINTVYFSIQFKYTFANVTDFENTIFNKFSSTSKCISLSINLGVVI